MKELRPKTAADAEKKPLLPVYYDIGPDIPQRLCRAWRSILQALKNMAMQK
jgi:hypothetical protein